MISRAPKDRARATGFAGLWEDLQRPARVPPIALIVGLVIAIVLIVVAYGVGRSVGYSQAAQYQESETRVIRDHGSIRSPEAPVPPPRTTNAIRVPGVTGQAQQPGHVPAQQPPSVPPGAQTRPTTPTAGQPPVVPPHTAGPAQRQSKLNYMVLATLPHEEAQRLVQFLASSGVEAGAFPGHNVGSFKVVALRGFTREQLGSQVRKDYEKELKRLGRLWKTQKNGATDLADMYPELYDEGEARPTAPAPRRNTR